MSGPFCILLKVFPPTPWGLNRKNAIKKNEKQNKEKENMLRVHAAGWLLLSHL